MLPLLALGLCVVVLFVMHVRARRADARRHEAHAARLDALTADLATMRTPVVVRAPSKFCAVHR